MSYPLGLIQDNVKTEARTSSSVTDFKLTSGFLNGILVNVPEGVGESTITAKYSPADGSKAIYLLQNHPLNDFDSISSQFGGHDYEATSILQRIVNGLKDLTGTTMTAQDIAYAERNFKTNIDINFGDVVLSGSTLEVTINWKWSGTINRTISISRYESERNPARLFIYEQSKEVDKEYSDVEQIFLMTESPENDLDLQIKVQDEFTSQDASFEQFHQMSLTTGRYSSAPLGVVPIQIYGSVLPVPQTVQVNLTGADTAKVRTVVKKEILIPSEVSASTINESERLIRLLRNLERKNPLKARAYRHRLGLPKSQALENRLNSIL